MYVVELENYVIGSCFRGNEMMNNSILIRQTLNTLLGTCYSM